MRRLALVVMMLATGILPRLWAQAGYLTEADRLSHLGKDRESIQLLESKLPTVRDSREQAALYWRLARATFDIANVGEMSGGSGREYLDLYEQSETYADRSIALDPSNAKGYYWKAVCVGKIAQIRNLLRAFLQAGTVRDLLFKAGRLDPGDGEIWYVLAQLYYQIPGFPISFGNSEYAVSFGRKGLSARKAQAADGSEPDVPEDYYVQLARELVKRNWSQSERARRQPQEAKKYHSASDPVEKNSYFDGVAEVPDLSDREEAIEIDRGVVARLEAEQNRTPTQDNDLENARRDLTKWGG